MATVDISIYSRFVDPNYYTLPSGTYYVYGSGGGGGGGGTLDPANYYTKTELQAGALDDLYVDEVPGAANRFLFTDGNGDASISSKLSWDGDSSIHFVLNSLTLGVDPSSYLTLTNGMSYGYSWTIITRPNSGTDVPGTFNIGGQNSSYAGGAGSLSLSGGYGIGGAGGAAYLVGGNTVVDYTIGGGGGVIIRGGEGAAWTANSQGGNVEIDGGSSYNNLRNGSIYIGLNYAPMVQISTDTSIDGTLKVTSSLGVGGTANVIGDVSLGADLYVDEAWSLSPFFSGWAGTGYRLENDSGEYGLELDNLRVRGQMNVYELIVNKIRATNGSLWVSDGQQAIWPGDASTSIPAGLYWQSTGPKQYDWYYYTDSSLNTFVTDDLIKAQRFDGTNVGVWEYVVVDTDGIKTYVKDFGTERQDGGGPFGNMTLVDNNMDTWTSGGSGYDWEGLQNEWFRTDYFTCTGKGLVEWNATWDSTGDYGSISMQVFDGDDTPISTFAYFTFNGPTSLDSSARVLYDLGESGRTTDTSAYIKFKVTAVGGAAADLFNVTSIKDYTLTTANGENNVDGFDFVRVGNLTDTDRQGALYLTASDSDAPFLQVIDEVDTFTIGVDNQKVRLGKLDGINDPAVGGALTGYGLYTDNAYLKGSIWATDGSIGGWNLDASAIWVGTKTVVDGYSASGLTLAADGGMHAMNAYINADGDCAFRQIEEAVFKVDDSSWGIKIQGSQIWENEYNGYSYVHVNYHGYNGGDTQYRAFVVGDGKGSANIWYVNPDPALGGYGIKHWIETFFEDGVCFNTYNGTASHLILQHEIAAFNYDTATVNSFTLPAAPYDGQIQFVRNRYNSGGRNLTVIGGSAGAIDGATGSVYSITLAPGSSGIFMWNDSVGLWQIMAAYSAGTDANSW